MKTGNIISDSEWEIMKIIWSNGPLSASEIIALLEGKFSWNDKTIRTLIKRLVDKKVLGFKKDKVYIYYSIVTQDQCVKEVTDDFIDKVYNGSVGLFISNFVKGGNLKKEDIKILKALLDDKDDKK